MLIGSHHLQPELTLRGAKWGNVLRREVLGDPDIVN